MNKQFLSGKKLYGQDVKVIMGQVIGAKICIETFIYFCDWDHSE